MNTSNGSASRAASRNRSAGSVFDTSVMVLRSRRGSVDGTERLMRAAMDAIETGRAAIPLATRMELLLSARASDVVQPRIASVPVVVAPEDVADAAGAMGAFLRTKGSPIQFPDLIIRSEEHTSELQSPCNLVCR